METSSSASRRRRCQRFPRCLTSGLRFAIARARLAVFTQHQMLIPVFLVINRSVADVPKVCTPTPCLMRPRMPSHNFVTTVAPAPRGSSGSPRVGGARRRDRRRRGRVHPQGRRGLARHRCRSAPARHARFSRISPGLWYPGGHSSGLSDSRFLRITALSGERERTGCFRTRDSWEFGV